MINYTFPETSMPEVNEVAAKVDLNKDYERCVYIPASAEIIKSLKIDQEVTVKLEGVIKMLESREGSEYSRQEFEIQLKSISVDSANEFTDLAEDDD